MRMNDWKDYDPFQALFKKTRKAKKDEPLAKKFRLTARDQLPNDACDSYLEWWKCTIKKRLPPKDRSDTTRLRLMLWTDRMMFCLGKAAILVVEENGKATPSPPAPSGTERK